MTELLPFLAFASFFAVAAVLHALRVHRRRAYIGAYAFPSTLAQRLLDHHPTLDGRGVQMVFDGLRQWFLACLNADRTPLGMPSRAVDDAWHEFILMTREYHDFCSNAFGRYLNHTPNAVADKPTPEAIPKTLELLDREGVETIGGMPLLFAADQELRVERGRKWTRASVYSISAGGACSGVADCSSGDGCGGDGCDGCGGCCG